MKLTDQEIQMFKALQSSELGKSLAAYLERMEADICDVRNWDEKDTVESARMAARAIASLRKRLGTQGGTQSSPNEYV